MAFDWTGIGAGLGAIGAGLSQGRRLGEAEAYRRQQIALGHEERKAQREAQAEYRRMLAQLGQEKLQAQADLTREKITADAAKQTRAVAGRIASELERFRSHPKYAGFFQQYPELAKAYDARIGQARGVAAGTIPAEQFDEDQFNAVVGAARDLVPDADTPGPIGGTSAPGLGGPWAPGRFPVDLGGGRTVAAPDFPEMAAGTAIPTPGGGTFVPTAPGAAPPPAPPTYYETAEQREARLKREAKAAADAAKAPLTAAQAALAASRAKKTEAEAGTVPKEASSKQLLRERQGRKAAAEAKAAPVRAQASATTAGASATRAQTDKQRLAEQKRQHQAQEEDRARRTALAELNGAATRAKSRADVTKLQKTLSEAKGKMSDVDRKAWDYWAKRATRTVKGDFGKEELIDDPDAAAELEKLRKKYAPTAGAAGTGAPVLGRKTGTAKARPADVDEGEWDFVGRHVAKGTIKDLIAITRKKNPEAAKRMERIYRLQRGGR